MEAIPNALSRITEPRYQLALQSTRSTLFVQNSFRVLVKAEFDNYNGEQRMRYTALRVDVMDSHSLALLLYQQIKTAVSCDALCVASAASSVPKGRLKKSTCSTWMLRFL